MGVQKMVYIIAPLGFDIRPVIRAMMDSGFADLKGVYLIVPKGEKDQRVETALSEVEKVAIALNEVEKVAQLGSLNELKKVEVDYNDFFQAILSIRKLIDDISISGEKIIVSLRGGMRVLDIEVLIACLIAADFQRKRLEVFIYPESGEGTRVSFTVQDVTTISNLYGEEFRLLNAIKEMKKGSITSISERLKIPKSTAWKRINKLVEMGLVRPERRKYVLTELGERVVEANNKVKYK